MDASAVKEMVKAIKEGAKSMTPLANEFINQVRYNGIVNIVSSLICFLFVFITIQLTRKVIKKKFTNSYSYDEITPEGFFVLMGAGVLISILMILAIISLNEGLSQLVSPLYYLLSK